MHKLFLLGLSVSMTACLTAKTNEDTDDTGNTSSSLATIYDIQTGIIAEGETVTLRDVVVTTMLTGDEEGFFIQDEGGGEYTGLYVFVGQAGGGIAPFVGDKITITGSVSEYYDSTQLVVSSAESISVTGETEVVATPLTTVEDWEAYEGVLISLADQTVTSDVNSYGEADLSAGLPLDNLFFNFETEYGAHYDSITGVVTYSFEQFKVNPRSADDMTGYTAGEGADPVTVSEVQSGDFTNRRVILENVVVTEASSDFDGYSVFWIQDEGAGDWSGLYVFIRENTAAAVSISRGDKLNIQGMIEERYDQTQLVLSDPDDVEILSSNEAPISTVVEGTPNDWEMYEGMLITLSQAEIGAGGSYGQYEFANFEGIKLDDELYRYSVAQGDVIDSLTGLVYFSYGEFTLLPRDEIDMGQEGNNNNNTGDAGVVSIMECRTGVVNLGNAVTIEGAVVTAVSGNKVYVQDATATSDAGMLLYFGSTTFTATAGDVITVSGELTEYSGVLEVVVSTEADFFVTGTGSVSPVTVSAPPPNWETYESMWVSLDGVTVTAGPDSNGNFETNFDLILSDYWNADLASSVTVGNIYGVTGIINYFSSNFELLTSGADDIVAQ